MRGLSNLLTGIVEFGRADKLQPRGLVDDCISECKLEMMRLTKTQSGLLLRVGGQL